MHFCLTCNKTFTNTFDTLYYRRKLSPEQMRIVLQAHAEGSSLRGISRTTKLAYNTVVKIVRDAAVKAQMIHNEEVQEIDTKAIAEHRILVLRAKKQKNCSTTEITRMRLLDWD